jgi:prepilin-type N-terminal cleavage/methylation domain-containing protein
MNRRVGFTLIELLTVIAIIVILTAIVFPVYMRAKDSAYRNSDLSNMNTLRSALQLYRADQGAYPPALLGYATLYQSGPNAGNVVPAEQLETFLYPRRVDSLNTFQAHNDRFSNVVVTPAVWPNQDSRAIGTAPILDLNGDGAITDADDLANARQAAGPPDGWVAPTPSAGWAAQNPPYGVTNNQANALSFYEVSGYDVAQVPAVGGGTQWEVHYALFWTVWGLTGGNGQDDPRQLGYLDPPDSTPVTWDSYFRDYSAGSPQPLREKRDIVLFLGGSARPWDSAQVYQQSWRIMP